jgi:hypothetical protein
MKLSLSLIFAICSVALIAFQDGDRRVPNDFSTVDRFIDSHADLYRDHVVVLVSQHSKIICKKEVGADSEYECGKTNVSGSDRRGDRQGFALSCESIHSFSQATSRYGIGNWLDVIDTQGNVLESSSPGLFGTHPWLDTKNHVAGIVFTVTPPRVSNRASLETRKLVREAVELKK